jgi:hypothetical protein
MDLHTPNGSRMLRISIFFVFAKLFEKVCASAVLETAPMRNWLLSETAEGRH